MNGKSLTTRTHAPQPAQQGHSSVCGLMDPTSVDLILPPQHGEPSQTGQPPLVSLQLNRNDLWVLAEVCK